MSRITLSREELYKLVWSEPLSSLSERLKIPYDDLRKVCGKMNIPLPKTGHWTKVKAGKVVSMPELFADNREGNTEVEFPLGDSVVLSREAILIKEIESKHGPLLNTQTELTNPDKLTTATERGLKNKSPSTTGKDAGMVYSNSGTLRMLLSPSNVDRALRFYDALIKLLTARGHKLTVDERETCIIVGEETFKIKLQEKSRQTGTSGTGGMNYEPTGLLYFKIDRFDGVIWRDGRKPLEQQLAQIVAKFEILTEEEK